MRWSVVGSTGVPASSVCLPVIRKKALNVESRESTLDRKSALTCASLDWT